MARRLINFGFVLALWGCDNQRPADQGARQPPSSVSAPTGSMALTDGSDPDGRTRLRDTPAAIQAALPHVAETRIDESFAGTEAGQKRNDNALKLELVWCPPGEFSMGNPAEEHEEDGVDPAQVRVVLRDGFWLASHELSQAQWTQVMDTEPWKAHEEVREGADYPATYVSWIEALEFCRKLTEQERQAGHLPEGWLVTLPTEAQWEYACRAGTTTSYSFGDDSNVLSDYAWFGANTVKINEGYAHQLGLKRKNAWALYDMHGNVWELCRDAYEEILPGGRDPEITVASPFRVIRGGSWNSTARKCRSVDRLWNVATFRYSYVGFRVAWTAARRP